MPRSLAEMAKILPLDAVLRLAARYGGTRVSLPRNPPPDSEIALILGRVFARNLGAKLGGAEIEMPRRRAVLRRIRNPQIRRARKAGASMNALVLRFGLTSRQLRRICNGGSDE